MNRQVLQEFDRININNNMIDSYLQTDRSATPANDTRRNFEQEMLGKEIKQVITTPKDFTEDKSLHSSRLHFQQPPVIQSSLRYPWEVPLVEQAVPVID